MKKIVILFNVLCVFSCTNEKTHPTRVTEFGVNKKFSFDYAYNDVIVVQIDSCEYLYGAWSYATVLTHKGNCKNHSKGSYIK